MTVDLLHNKIVKETITEKFIESVNGSLCPKLEGIFGDALLGIQMYEDYLADEFVKDKFRYYPLTVVLTTGIETVWIKWDTSRAKDFRDGIPYSFIGESLDIVIADDTPAAFSRAIEGRAKFFEGGCVKLNVVANAPSITMLSGKYSQTFIDELNRQISDAVCRATGVRGIEDSTIEIDVVFTPETYMEHTSENITYRRLLMSAKGCSARDFWIKWTRLNSSVAFSMTDAVKADEVVFEIGEDVPHKIREKEYRFLVYGKSEKYRAAMGRKNITEWRELIKRAIKRGELIKDEADIEIDEDTAAVSDKLSEILARCGVTVPTVKDDAADDYSDTNAALLSVLAGEVTDEDIDGEPEFTLPDGIDLSLDDISESAEDTVDSIADAPFDIPVENAPQPPLTPIPVRDYAEDETVAAKQREIEEARRRLEEERLAMEEAKRELESQRAAMEEARRRYEAELAAAAGARSQYEDESRARQLAEAEAARLRAEQESLLRENERLAEERRIAEETRAREEAVRREQEERLREQLELEAREKTREKLLFAEAARLAREEHDRMIAERNEAEELRRREAERIEALRRAEAERAAEEERVRRERERIEAEARARVDESARRRAEIEARALEARVRMEDEARLGAAAKASASSEYARPAVPTPAPTPVSTPMTPAPSAPVAFAPKAEPTPAPVAPAPVAPVPEPEYTYVSKLVRLMFRRPIDPNITARIHEMISIALSHYGKEHVYIKVRASIPDTSTVVLNFVKIPEEELPLLVDVIKFLGNSDLGIYKVILE